MPVDPVRDAAVDVLLRVFERGAYVTVALDKTLRRKHGLSPRGKRFLTQLAYGTARHKLLCEHIIRPMLHQPFEKLPAAIQVILCMGVYQALFLRQVTFPAMVHTSVELAKKRGHAGTARLVNAVLNRAPQTIDDVKLPDFDAEPAAFLSTRYSIAEWLVQQWIDSHGLDEAREFCEAADEEAPRTIRVNTRITTQEALLRDLAKAGVPAEAHPIVPDACILADAIPTRAHLFREGHFYVQDAASMLPPHLLQPEAGQAVLDLCAAPGGKSTHLAELSGGKAVIIANELHPNKIHLLRENAERLGHERISIVVADVLAPPFGPVFDRVLLDAPCTGLGTLRRHPELKWRTRPGDPARMAELQRQLLRSAVALCKIDGVIVYSVCTFTTEETEGVIAPILGDLPVEPEDGPEWLNPWKINPGTFRILPRKNHLDGYFLIRLRKRS